MHVRLIALSELNFIAVVRLPADVSVMFALPTSALAPPVDKLPEAVRAIVLAATN